MRIISTVRQMWAFSAAGRGQATGFVPTMGALHEGHASLIRRARKENKRVVVSIFVNPLQFGPKEDFSRYPRTWPSDRALCAALGADAVFRPTAAEMYPEGFRTAVEVRELSSVLCGEFRPGHFSGVATVVLKLLLAVRPDRAYFGEKDFQQLVVIQRLARDLSLGTRIVPCATVREPDGLALSSRNRYLSPEERRLAPRLYETLRSAAGAGATPGAARRALRERLESIPGASVDYVEIVDPRTLLPAAELKGKLRVAAALRLGATRLIDNCELRF